jgi:general secretion pathway protein B
MSYILDALKKAERERGLAEVPTLAAIHDLPRRNNYGMWTALAILVLCMLTALWLFYPSKKKDIRSPAPEVLGASQGSIPSPLSAIVPLQPARPMETPLAPIMKTVEKNGSTVAGPSSAERLNNVRPDTVNRVLSPERADSVSPDTVANSSQAKIPSRNVDVLSPAVLAKSMSLNDAIARMIMTIHLYGENKEERLVFINGKKYFEGDSPEQGVVIESITPEGAVLRSGGERAVLRPGSR